MKTLPVFNKWVLVSVLAVLSLLLAAALMAPATNWYYALSNEASPEFNAVYFPLRGVFALLQKQQILFSYTGFNCFLAALSALSFWLVAILAYKWQKVLGVLVLSLSYSATISVVWLSVLSPAVALLQLGMAALLLLQAIKPKCPLPLFVPLQALSFLLVMGTSALWMPVVAAVILVELWLDKGVYKNLIAFALAALATLFFDPLFLRNLTAFIAAQPGITYYFNAVTYQGDNLPRFYAFAQLIRFYSPYLLLAAVASGFFFRQIKSI
ncbi:hypothetical protein GC194_02765 [bacterium]|nr:hypothetical protein [bacterium]